MVFEFLIKTMVMLPMWFFTMLILGICYLLYNTRKVADENFTLFNKSHFKKLHWKKQTTEK